MRRAVVLLGLATIAAAAPDEKEIRTALHAILSEPKEADRKKLIEGLGDGGAPLEEVEQVIRKGPIYPRDAADGKRVVRVGRAAGGYEIAFGGETYGYAVHVPADYDPEKGSPVLLDPGHGSWSKKELEEKLKGEVAGKPKKERARAIGKAVGERLKAAGVTAVVFDRNGFIFHGRVKEVADGARDAGLQF